MSEDHSNDVLFKVISRRDTYSTTPRNHFRAFSPEAGTPDPWGITRSYYVDGWILVWGFKVVTGLIGVEDMERRLRRS